MTDPERSTEELAAWIEAEGQRYAGLMSCGVKERYDEAAARLRELKEQLDQYSKCHRDHHDGTAHGGAALCVHCENRLRTELDEARRALELSMAASEHWEADLLELKAKYRKSRDAAWEKIGDLERQRDELQAIVDKLPKTADGVVVVPGEAVYRVVPPFGVLMSWGVMVASPGDVPLDACFSTRLAAEQAKGGE